LTGEKENPGPRPKAAASNAAGEGASNAGERGGRGEWGRGKEFK